MNGFRARGILLILIGVLPASCSLLAPSDAELRKGNDGAGDCAAGVGALGGGDGAGAGNAVWGWTGGTGGGGEAGNEAGAPGPSLGGTSSNVR